jgi:DNA helicase-2/ATP-dependent DNA helicase PcrA
VVERRYDRPAARLADLDQLVRAAPAASSRSRFVTELTLDPPLSTGDLAGPPVLDEDWLVLSTVHSAKGGEWDVVHVLHAADGMFPSDMATGDPDGIEEERRLFYVAVTRARDVLEVNVPFRFHHRPGLGDAHSYAQASRFLSSEVRATMDTAQVGRLDNLAPLAAGGRGGGLAAIDGWLGDLWH